MISPLLSSLDLQLETGSSCINAGNPLLSLSAGETDYYGNPRIVNGLVDIGAQEFQNPLGVNHNDNPAHSTVYPNPFTTETTIFSAVDLADTTFSLYDQTGKLVRDIKNFSGNKIVLNRQGLCAGLYFYRITKGNHSVSVGKIIAE